MFHRLEKQKITFFIIFLLLCDLGAGDSNNTTEYDSYNNTAVVTDLSLHPLLVDPLAYLHAPGMTCTERVVQDSLWWFENGWDINEYQCFCLYNLDFCNLMPEYIQVLLSTEAWDYINEQHKLSSVEIPPYPDNFFTFFHPNGYNESKCLSIYEESFFGAYWKAWNISGNSSITFRECHCRGNSRMCNKLLDGGFSLDMEFLQPVIDSFFKSLREGWIEKNEEWAKFYYMKNIEISVTSTVVAAILLICGSVGNGLVMVTIWKYLPKNNVTNMFIFNLSLSDFIVIIFALPFRTWKGLTTIWYFGDGVCKAMFYVYYMSFMLSVLTQTAMAFERYLVIVHPMKAKYISTPGRARRIIAFIWFLSLCGAILPSYLARRPLDRGFEPGCGYYSNFADLNTEYHYRKDPHYVILMYYLIFGIFLVPVTLMSIVYFRTGKALHDSIKVVRKMTNQKTDEDLTTDQRKLPEHKAKENETKQRIEVVKMLILVLIVFIITWLPSLIYEALVANQRNFLRAAEVFSLRNDDPAEIKEDYIQAVFDNEQELRVVIMLLTMLTFLGSCLNPMLYTFSSKTFKRGFGKMLKCHGCCEAASTMRSELSSSSISSNATALTSRGTIGGTSGVLPT